MCGYGGGGISVCVLGSNTGPQEGQGSPASLSGHTAADPAGPSTGSGCDQTAMAHIALFARMHWATIKDPLGFVRDEPPRATAISRALAAVPWEQLQAALAGWVSRVAAGRQLSVPADGKWAKQSVDQSGNPPVMVNAPARDLKLCLAQRPAPEKRCEPGVLRERLGQLLESCPGLQLLTMDAWYAERDLRQAIVNCRRDYMVRVKENRPDVLAALAGGFAGGEPGDCEAETLEKKRALPKDGASGPVRGWPAISGTGWAFPERDRG